MVEIIRVSIMEKKIVLSRGYLIGPYLPIFGFGSLMMVYCLSRYQGDNVAIFVFSVVICCLLEYFTSLIMEKIFKIRWWDYSNRKFNIDGRICLENSIYFGISGVCLLSFLNPLVSNLIYDLDNNIIYILGISIFVIMVLDFVISTISILKLKLDTSMFGNMDATSMVKKEVFESLQKYMFFYKRIFAAFPYIAKSKSMRKVKKTVDKIQEKE
ncbi:MAG: putative ABC transporter permease [Bacilli bacterium]|nr:putative ABC transporter permease [Bacilli bacterium]